MRCILADYTDKGKRKKVNQDSMLLRGTEAVNGQKALLAAVCDGMGGFEQGEFASREMVRMLSEWFETEFPEFCTEKDDDEFEDILFESWEALFQAAHRTIRSYGELHGIRLGTTATVMLFMRNRYYTAHVGDSRAYEITDQIIRLTQDQNVANVSGTKEQYLTQTGKKKKASSILLQGIGASKSVCPVYDSGELKCGAAYLLCSDGFLNRAGEPEILEQFLPEKVRTKNEMIRQMKEFVRILRERGERDDITALLVRTTDPEKEKEV